MLTADDVAAFEPAFEAPATLEFRGWTVVKSGPWAQGPVLLQALGILDALAAERGDGVLDPSTGEGAHAITEALRLAMADRDARDGDAGPSAGELAGLLAPAYARARAELVGDRASTAFEPGPGAPWTPPLRDDAGAPVAGLGEPTVDRRGVTRGDTCHLDVVDRWGNMISATPSGGWLQSSPTIPELGFCLGSRLQAAWLDERSPSALAPGRRPRSTLSPTMLVRDGRAVEALGSPGGDQQDQWQLPYLLRRVVGGYTPQQAIDAPSLHTTTYVSSFAPRVITPGVVVEDRMPAGVVEDLETRGHRVTRSAPWSLGRLSAVGRDDDGVLFAAANPRGAQGYAVGR